MSRELMASRRSLVQSIYPEIPNICVEYVTIYVYLFRQLAENYVKYCDPIFALAKCSAIK